MAKFSDKNVCGLDVAMDDSFCVSRIQCVGYLKTQVQHLFERKWLAGNSVFQCLSIQKLHRNERLAILPADVINRANVGVIESRSRFGFTPESFERLRVAGKFFRKELQGHKTVEACVLGLVNDTHPASTEFIQDAVV